MPRFWTKHRLSTHMLKRLAQLSSPNPSAHNHGTPMTALEFRGMVENPDRSWCEDFRQYDGPCCVITDLGREALAEARAEGW